LYSPFGKTHPEDQLKAPIPRINPRLRLLIIKARQDNPEDAKTVGDRIGLPSRPVLTEGNLRFNLANSRLFAHAEEVDFAIERGK
jgi:hypothetical protein